MTKFIYFLFQCRSEKETRTERNWKFRNLHKLRLLTSVTAIGATEQEKERSEATAAQSKEMLPNLFRFL